MTFLTEYGEVEMSPSVKKAFDDAFKEVMFSTKRSGKRYQEAKDRLNRIEQAVVVIANIKGAQGEELRV